MGKTIFRATLKYIYNIVKVRFCTAILPSRFVSEVYENLVITLLFNSRNNFKRREIFHECLKVKINMTTYRADKLILGSGLVACPTFL